MKKPKEESAGISSSGFHTERKRSGFDQSPSNPAPSNKFEEWMKKLLRLRERYLTQYKRLQLFEQIDKVEGEIADISMCLSKHRELCPSLLKKNAQNVNSESHVKADETKPVFIDADVEKVAKKLWDYYRDGGDLPDWTNSEMKAKDKEYCYDGAKDLLAALSLKSEEEIRQDEREKVMKELEGQELGVATDCDKHCQEAAKEERKRLLDELTEITDKWDRGHTDAANVASVVLSIMAWIEEKRKEMEAMK